MTEEIWKPVDGYEDYEVSNLGQVKRITPDSMGRRTYTSHLLTLCKNPQGYPIIVLTKNKERTTMTVHRLVAEAFLENTDNKSEINHKDGIRHNNNIANLEWVTSSENRYHRYNVLGHAASRKSRNAGSKHGKKTLSDEDVVTIYQLLTQGANIEEVATKYHISKVYAWRISRKTSRQNALKHLD